MKLGKTTVFIPPMVELRQTRLRLPFPSNLAAVHKLLHAYQGIRGCPGFLSIEEKKGEMFLLL